MAYSIGSWILANMNIETGDLVFYIYEFFVILGLLFRLCLKSKENANPKVEVEILPPLRPTEPMIIDAVPISIIDVPKPKRKHPVSKTEYYELFKEALDWCQKNIKIGTPRKVPPNIRVSFNRTGNELGYYQYSKLLIMMYVLRNKTLKGVIQTFIHEYVHYLDIRNSKDNVRYKSLSRRKGYYDNDYEVRARELSSKYIDECYEYLNL